MAIKPRDDDEYELTATSEQVRDLLPPELAHDGRYQRLVALLVRAGGDCSTRVLVRHLVDAESQQRGTDVEQYRSLHLWVHCTAIPTLRALEVLDYDRDRGHLTLHRARE